MLVLEYLLSQKFYPLTYVYNLYKAKKVCKTIVSNIVLLILFARKRIKDELHVKNV